MRWFVRSFVLLSLAAAVFAVYEVRSVLSHNDADPAATASLQRSLQDLPLSLAGGRFVGKEDPIPEDIVKTAGADCYASVIYSDREGGFRCKVYVGGSVANSENFHAPSYCMPAQGWEILDESTVPFVAYPVEQSGPRMRRLILQHGEARMLVYYWFEAGDRLADHEWAVRWYRFLDLMRDVFQFRVHGRKGSPFRPTLIVSTYFDVAGSVQATEKKALAFLRTVGPELHAAILSGE